MRQHERDVAALAQWAPLMQKMSFKAAQRAEKIGSSLRQDDFKQELAITTLACIDSYDPNHESGAKLITLLHRAYYNEINKLLHIDTRNLNGGQMTPYKEISTIFTAKHNGIDRSYIDPNSLDLEYLNELLEDEIITDGEYKRIRKAMNRQTVRTISGDHIAEGDDGGSVDVWGYLEDDSERSAENRVMDEEVMQFVRKCVSGEACAVIDMLSSDAPFLMQQLEAYNEGAALGEAAGGMRKLKLDLDFSFICKLLGISSSKAKSMADEVKQAVKTYALG